MNDNNLYPRFSDSEFANRYASVRASMQEAGLSALILHGTAGSYQEIQFLSNFLVTREAMRVFPQDGEPTMFVQYYNHLPNARHVSAIKDIRWGGIDITATTANNLQERELAQSQIGSSAQSLSSIMKISNRHFHEQHLLTLHHRCKNFV